MVVVDDLDEGRTELRGGVWSGLCKIGRGRGVHSLDGGTSEDEMTDEGAWVKHRASLRLTVG